MDRLFTARRKSPTELVKALKECLVTLERLEKGDKKYDKTQEDIGKHLAGIKQILYGTGEQEPQTQLVAELAQEVYNANLLHQLINNVGRVDFEAKKDVALVFNNLLRRQIGTRSPTVEYVVARPDILITLINGYEQPDIALTCGNMLRECVRHEPLARIVLHSAEFDNFFQYVEVSTFDVASDAFSSFKDIVTKHKTMCAEYLDRNYVAFFDNYEKLLKSENYVTRRQSLKLLGELLLDRHNFTVMTRYIGNAENLKLMMNMLKDKSNSIQFEAFHVFKVFVANPNKPRPIAEILLRNRDKLVEFLTKFQTERTEDDQFNDEKAYLIKQINDMKALPPLPPSGGAPASTAPSGAAANDAKAAT